VTSPDLGAIFSAARAEFASLSPLLWQPAAAATLDLSKPRPGERVLDVCCGAGASALPTAEAVGPDGRVDAIDLAGGLLEVGRARAAERGLDQLRFVQADATTWRSDDGDYDLVQCVYGIFFLPKMDEAAARLVSLLRPGGRFAVATWERGAIHPVPEIIVQAIKDAGVGSPPEEATRMPGQQISTRESFVSWLSALGLHDVEVSELANSYPLTADNAWALIMGGGMRALLMSQDADTVERVRVRFLDLLAERDVHTFNATTLIGVGAR
jgi:ubiquinone/menaquinone biosynthesis C-methylase UbiE